MFSQKKTPSISIFETTETIKIDGVLDEKIWKNCETAANFYNSYPMDTSFALTKTEAKISYDDKNIYISAVCYDELNGDFIIQSLKRDFSYPRSDAFSFIIEPYGDNTNGYSFAVNPYGVQREGVIQNGGTYGVTTAWDNLWYSEVKRYKGYWIVEMAIPFSSIRYNVGVKKWSINFTRNDLKRNESSSWAAVPRSQNIAALAFCGTLNWDKPVKKSKAKIAIIPYVSGNTFTNYENKEEDKLGYNAGIDAKIGIGSSLQLDLTVNPDFSQVEVDAQVTNLSRFSIFYPERRNFFIENSDLFSQFGFRNIRPIFSRKIGLNNGSVIPILAGARLSGKLGKDWRIGIMDIQTEGKENIKPQNYSVMAVQRKVLSNSNIGIIAVNRMAFEDKTPNFSNYNRIIGLDFNYISPKNDWLGKVFYHHSFTPNITQDNFTHASFLLYKKPKVSIMWNHEYVGENYIANIGFVPRQSRTDEFGVVKRNSFWRLEPEIGYKFYSKKENAKLIYHQSSIYLDQYLDKDFKNTDYLLVYRHGFKFQNSSEVSVSILNNYTKLFYQRDVSFSGKQPIEAGDYNYSILNLNYISDIRKPLNYTINSQYGEYYNGNILKLKGELGYRFQPYGSISVNVSQNKIWLPHLNKSVDLTLIGAKTQISFTKSIFFTNFLQYNTQIKNFNINSRLQWRFKPMSDLFLVYSENYLSDNLSIKNRGLVLKFVYWFQ